ncbi:hypothetical protein ACOCHS_06390 [Propionibacteriaceae bacterium Y2011]
MDLTPRVWRKADLDDSSSDPTLTPEGPARRGANIVCSDLIAPHKPSMHYPVIDLDIPVTLIPSSTPGHSHLYIDTAVPWDKFVDVLQALAHAGIVEQGYADASVRRGYSAVRLPWIKKKTTPASTEGKPTP